MDDADVRPLADRYWETLENYLRDASETSLARGYEIGRRALQDGDGVLELAAIHHQALRRIQAHDRATDAGLRAAGEFFAECLSPFEMSHRGVQEGNRALRRLSEALETELKRIAHALHDEAGQLLASVHITVADIAGDLPPPARARLEDVELLLNQVEAQLRNLSHELRPTVLDNLGLVPALEFLAEKVAKRTGLAIFVDGEREQRLPAAIETALYRIVQEALNNVVKHAHAHTVWIELRHLPSRVECSIRDDGRGFAGSTTPGVAGLGLVGIRERLNALGGTLQLVTAHRAGVTLRVEIPLGD